MQSYAARCLRPLYDRADHRKVIIWHTMETRWVANTQGQNWDINDGEFVMVRVWHAWCGPCLFPQCCRTTTTYYTGQEARAAMAQHWAEVHA